LPPFATLKAKSGLLAGKPIVVIKRIDCHTTGVDLFIAQCQSALFEDLVVIVAWQARTPAGAGYTQFGLGFFVPRCHLGAVYWPVEEIGPLDCAVTRQRFPLVILKAQACTRPMGCCAAHGLDDPGGKAGEILCHPPIARGGAGVGPGQLAETFPFVIDIVFGHVTAARL
jgi:hypothetical protein